MVKTDSTQKPRTRSRPDAARGTTPRPRPPSKVVYRRRRVLVAACALLAVLLAAFAVDGILRGDTVARNVRVGGVDVGGLDRASATERISSRAGDLLRSRITVQAGETTLQFMPGDLGVTIDTEATVDAAMQAGGGWNPLGWLAGWVSHDDVEFQGVGVSPERVRQRIGPSFADVEDAAEDARFVVDGETVRIEPSRSGHGLDVEQAQDAIAQAVVATGENRLAVIPLSEVEPSLTTEQASAMGIQERLATFTTKFPPGEPRVKNIERIGELVDQTTLAPGERYSVNETVGPRTVESGFIQAPVIYDGEFSDDIGGGVSQFGTTLFNAVYFAGLPIEEFRAHSFYISRYPIGREATLSYPHPDVVFTNDYPNHILLKVDVGRSQITVSVYGTGDGREVTSETGPKQDPRAPRIECQQDVTLKPGTEKVKQKADWGYTVPFTRTIVWTDGRTEDRTFVTTYAPKNRIVLFNPAPTPPPTTVPPATPAPAPAPAPTAPGSTAATTLKAAPAAYYQTAAASCPGANNTTPELADFKPDLPEGST